LTARLISVIGPPAVGKTTLAEQLSLKLPAQLIREDYRGNPFLADSYSGDASFRLPSQLYFVLSRVAQLSRSRWPSEGLVVTDYGFCQDAIFAELKLGREEFEIYNRVLRHVRSMVQQPDLLIHLDAGPQTLLRRIARRGRTFEASITEQFLSRMRDAYNVVAADQNCPVIAIDCDVADLMNPRVLERLVASVRESLA